jgi:cell division protein FtsW (lipid II flippase)
MLGQVVMTFGTLAMAACVAQAEWRIWLLGTTLALIAAALVALAGVKRYIERVVKGWAKQYIDRTVDERFRELARNIAQTVADQVARAIGARSRTNQPRR